MNIKEDTTADFENESVSVEESDGLEDFLISVDPRRGMISLSPKNSGTADSFLEKIIAPMNENWDVFLKKIIGGQEVVIQNGTLQYYVQLLDKSQPQWVMRVRPQKIDAENEKNATGAAVEFFVETQQQVDGVLLADGLEQQYKERVLALAFLRHEAGTPLNSLVGFADILQEMVDDRQNVPSGLRFIFKTIRELSLKLHSEMGKKKMEISTQGKDGISKLADIQKGFLETELLLKKHTTLISNALDIMGNQEESLREIFDEDEWNSSIKECMEILLRSLKQLKVVEKNVFLLNDGVTPEVNLQEFESAEELNMLHLMYGRKGVQVEANSEMVSFKTDRELLTQALINLINNATTFSRVPGSVTLRSVQEGEEVRFSVTDLGGGIEEEMIPHLFEKFYQAENQHNREDDGNHEGLGLAVVKKITDALGGRIEIQSKMGMGSTFTIVLPRKFQPANEDKSAEKTN